jgi:DNA-binding HxlR family transcriptional regulator
MKNAEPKQSCPVFFTLSLIAKKWTALIIKTLSDGAVSYSDIEKRATNISPTILSSRLKELQKFGFIEKRIVSENPVKIEYLLTEKGQSFAKHINAIADWSKEWMQK